MTQIRSMKQFAALAAVVGATVSCGDVSRSGQAPVFVVVQSISAVRGGGPDRTPASFLMSDVITNVTSPAPCTPATPCPTVFNDTGQATLSLALKDITNPNITVPTSNNSVTLTRYRVDYRRADGRNTPGVHVPYGFDGALTVTIPSSGTATAGFELVRHNAKIEAPLAVLRYNPEIITTLAEVTFYGTDVVGNDVVVKGNIQVDFGNFGDF